MRGKLILAGFSTLTALVLAEGSLRVVGWRWNPVHVKVGGDVTDWRHFHAFRDDHFQWDRELLWRPKPGTPPFTAEGWRGNGRLLTIGDSNTLGWADENGTGANWPQYLGETLGEPVRNGGVWGYSSHQMLGRLREGLLYDPEVIILCPFGNDAHLVRVSDAEYAARVLPDCVSRLRLGQLCMAARGHRDKPLEPRVSLDAYRANVLEMLRLCAGRTVIVTTRPYISEWDGTPAEHWWTWRAEAYNDATREIAPDHGVTVVDAYALFAGHREYFQDESHFNEAGHRRFAQYLAAAVLREQPVHTSCAARR